MHNMDQWKSPALIGILVIIMVLINNTQHRSFGSQNVRLQQSVLGVASQQQPFEMQREAAAQKVAEDAAREHARFLDRYLSSGFSRIPGIKSLALVVATQDGKPDPAVSDALANHFKSDTVTISTSFFKPEFVSDKLFASVFDGSPEVLTKLELAKSLDALLLARETVKFSRNPASLDNVLTANVQLEIQLVPIVGNAKHRSWMFTTNGAGFSQAEALSMAEERLSKAISADFAMLMTFSSN
jgi:hypothetical protein